MFETALVWELYLLPSSFWTFWSGFRWSVSSIARHEFSSTGNLASPSASGWLYFLFPSSSLDSPASLEAVWDMIDAHLCKQEGGYPPLSVSLSSYSTEWRRRECHRLLCFLINSRRPEKIASFLHPWMGWIFLVGLCFLLSVFVFSVVFDVLTWQKSNCPALAILKILWSFFACPRNSRHFGAADMDVDRVIGWERVVHVGFYHRAQGLKF